MEPEMDVVYACVHTLVSNTWQYSAYVCERKKINGWFYFRYILLGSPLWYQFEAHLHVKASLLQVSLHG